MRWRGARLAPRQLISLPWLLEVQGGIAGAGSCVCDLAPRSRVVKGRIMSDAVTHCRVSDNAFNSEALEGAQVALGLASRLVYCEPSDEDLATYAQEGFFDAAPYGSDDPAVVKGLSYLRSWAENVQTNAADEEFVSDCRAEVRRDWLSLFAGVGAPKAPCWAGFYTNPNKQVLSADTLPVRQMYRRWGFQVQRLNSEPDDNLGIMLGFVSYLIEVEMDGGEKASEAFASQLELFRDRILPWISAWRWSVEKYAHTDFYRGVGELAFGICRAYAQRFGFEYRDSEDRPRFVISSTH